MANDETPGEYSRAYEEALLDLAASGNVDTQAWRALGSGFFMGGIAVMLASARGFDRKRYLGLAEDLHPGITTVEAFDGWLRRSPVRAFQFLPMARSRLRVP